jgi:hypothetical protein
MRRRGKSAGLGLLAIGFLAMGSNFLTANDQKVDDKHAAQFEQCAKACTDCLRECESCAFSSGELPLSS